MIVSRTPLRISLVGGGTDVPAFYEKHPGCVISFAINKYVYICLNEKFDGTYRISYSKMENVGTIDQIKHKLVWSALDTWKLASGGTGWDKFNHGLEIVSIADIPGEGSGLGSSSAFTVGILNSFKYLADKIPMENKYLAEYAFDVENKINSHIGKQDHYAATYGGFRRYKFESNKVSNTEVHSIWDCGNPWSWNQLHENMLLLWTGTTRKSNDLLQRQSDGFSSGATLELGKELAALANEFYKSLVDGDIKGAAYRMREGWDLKTRLASGISNEWIDDWLQKAMNNGAWGGKLCGAGGGGFMFFFAPPDTHDRIVKATGLRKVDFDIDYEGSVIIQRRGWGDF